MNWDQWTITTALRSATGPTQMVLWKKSTGDLYVWRDLVWDDSTQSLSFGSSTKLAAGFQTGRTVGIQASFVGTETTPAVRVTESGSKVTTYHLVGTTWTSIGTTTMLTPSHVWQLADGSTGVAADDSGTAPLSASGAAPGAFTDSLLAGSTFDGIDDTLKTASGVLAVNTAKDFTVSAWVRPMALGRTVLSQQGTNASALRILTSTSGLWTASMATADTTTATYDTVAAGAVTLSSWAHVVVTYTAATSTLALYVSGQPAKSVTHAPVTWSSTNASFNVGTTKSAGTVGSFFNGQISDVLTWSSAIPAGAIPSIP
jgi:hypothetical protein